MYSFVLPLTAVDDLSLANENALFCVGMVRRPLELERAMLSNVMAIIDRLYFVWFEKVK